MWRYSAEHRARTALAGFVALLVCAFASATLAMANPAPIHIANTGGEGVYIRPDPNTSGPAVGWMPEGASPDYHCFAWGQVIGGVPIWFNVTYNGVTGYYASYYDDSSYHSNEELTAKYGVPLCGAAAPQPAPAPPPPPAPSPDPAPAPAAPLAVSCYGDYCSGRDPMKTGCGADAVTASFVNGEGIRLELRWSPRCKTNWARLVVYPRWMPPSSLWAEQSTGYKQATDVGAGQYKTATPIWTPMIYSPKKCVAAKFNRYPGYAWDLISTKCR